MKYKYKASIILSTYNWPEALALVLSGLITQTEKDFEVIIADDGSKADTKKTIAGYQARKLFPIKHLWQEDKGFRKSRILNQAIAAAEGWVLIFLDGDCIPHCDYIKYHLELQGKFNYVAGRRVDLSKEFSQWLTTERVEAGALNNKNLFYYIRLCWDCLRPGGSRPFHRTYIVRNKIIRKLFGFEKIVDLKGCNFSAACDDMQAINGFDEKFEGYGREDTDVELRLQNLGLKIRSAKNLCLQYHLWHEARNFTPKNETLLEEVKVTKRIRAIQGLREGVSL